LGNREQGKEGFKPIPSAYFWALIGKQKKAKKNKKKKRI